MFANTFAAETSRGAGSTAGKIIRAPQLFSEDFCRSWRALETRAEHPHFLHSVEWLRSLDKPEEYFAVVSIDGGDLRALSLVRERKLPVLGKSKYYVDGGPIAVDQPAFRLHLRQLGTLLRRSGLWLRLSPYVAGNECDAYEKLLGEESFRKLDEPASYCATVAVDLRPSLEKIRKGFRRSLKTQLNKSARSGIRIDTAGQPKDFVRFLRDFHSLKGHEISAKIAGADGVSLFRQFLREESRGVCLLAECDSEVLAGIVVLGSGERAIYQWGYSDKAKGSQYPLSHQLHWDAIKWAKSRGFEKYDFGGYWSERGDEDSINRFKSGFTRVIEPVCGEFQLTFSPLAESVLRIADQFRKAVNIQRYLPAYGSPGR